MTDLVALKERQQQWWTSGDFGIIARTTTIVGELLCEAVDLRPGQQVLDVATGTGNTALAAARPGGRCHRSRLVRPPSGPRAGARRRRAVAGRFSGR